MLFSVKTELVIVMETTTVDRAQSIHPQHYFNGVV